MGKLSLSERSSGTCSRQELDNSVLYSMKSLMQSTSMAPLHNPDQNNVNEWAGNPGVMTVRIVLAR